MGRDGGLLPPRRRMPDDVYVITARKPSRWRQQWDVARDGEPLARFDQATFRNRGRFTLDGRDHLVKGLGIGTKYALYAARVEGGEASDSGPVLAEATRVGRKDWSITTEGRTFHFRRRSMWRPDQDLVDDTDAVVGSIRRASMWNLTADADLPGLPDPVAVFAVLVVVLMWEASASAAASSGGT